MNHKNAFQSQLDDVNTLKPLDMILWFMAIKSASRILLRFHEENKKRGQIFFIFSLNIEFFHLLHHPLNKMRNNYLFPLLYIF